MKYAIVIPDGCADEPQESLGGKTPLQAAKLPNMDRVAQAGCVGTAHNVPGHLPAGSAVANMSLLGYDPNEFYTGRAPLEAAAQNIQLGRHDWAIRCNLVTIADQVMRDFTADHISTAEAAQLLDALKPACEAYPLELVCGVSYRNLMIYRGSEEQPAPFSMQTRCAAPHDLTDKSVADDFPRGPGSDLLNELMASSVEIFADHPVNAQRQSDGRLPATNVWLWGLGQSPQLPKFRDRFGVRGAMITAVDLLRGIAALIGWDRIEVPGATGYLDTDYAGKGRAACRAIDDYDLVCVHVEAPDEASHEGRVDAKIEALEQIDREIVGPLWEALQASGPARLLISPDHPTPIRTKTHSHGAVPWTIAGTGIEPDQASTYDEPTASRMSHDYPAGDRLMEFFVSQSPTESS